MSKREDKKPGTELAAEVWTLMSDLVLDQDRRRRVTEATGLSFGHARVVRRVAKRPMAMSRLAEKLNMDRSNTTVLVDRLESEGLVRRKQDPSDRRGRLVEATRKGRAVARKAEAVLGTPPPALSELDPESLESMDQALRGVAEATPLRKERK